MNRVVLFSDVHGNITGLKEIFKEIEKLENVTHIICCGDYFGYDGGADDIFEMLDAFQVKMIKGDHEEYLVKLNKDSNALMPHKIINETYDWLKLNLSHANFSRLLNLDTDYSLKLNDSFSIYTCHAGPNNLSSRTCATDIPMNVLRKTYSGIEENIVVYGHHHTPHVIPMDDKILVNCASVGMRKNDNICSYTVIEYNDERVAILQKSLKYDKEAADKLALKRKIPRI